MEEKDSESENFKNLVKSLPDEYHQTWHRIAQWGVMYLIMKNCARRGREGFDIMTKDHFEKRFCSKSKLYAWKQRKGEKTKNHQTTNQDLSKGGVITFKTYPNGKIFIYFFFIMSLRRKADQVQWYMTTALGQHFCVTDVK